MKRHAHVPTEADAPREKVDPNKQNCRVTCCDRQGHTLAFEVVEGTTEQCTRKRAEVFKRYRELHPDGLVYFDWNVKVK